MSLSEYTQRAGAILRNDVWSPIQNGWASVQETIDQNDTSLSTIHRQTDSFVRNDLWPSLQRGWEVTVVGAGNGWTSIRNGTDRAQVLAKNSWTTLVYSYDTSKILAKNSYTAVAAWIEQVRNDPPIYRDVLGDGTEIFVRLPYVGPVTLDVFCFGASALLFRIYMFWRTRRKTFGGNSGYTLRRRGGEDSRSSSFSPVKAPKVNIEEFRDPSLQQTIDECESVKSKLRKVEDPELARREKRRQLKINNMKSGKGIYLGMSEDHLQRARRHLKNVNVSNEHDSTGTTSRRPLSTKNTMDQL